MGNSVHSAEKEANCRAVASEPILLNKFSKFNPHLIYNYWGPERTCYNVPVNAK